MREALRRYLAEVVAAVVSEQSARPAPDTPCPAAFHRTLSLLREHPIILRALGLILELRLNASDLTPLANGTVRVTWPGQAAPLPPVVSPRTRFGAEFRPGAAPNLDAGMVTLDRLDASGARRWDVVTVDVDVATQRLREAARAMTDRPAEPVTLPALRSAGLQLLLRGRGDECSIDSPKPPTGNAGQHCPTSSPPKTCCSVIASTYFPKTMAHVGTRCSNATQPSESFDGRRTL